MIEQEVHSIVKAEEEKRLYNTGKYTTEITKLLSSIHIFSVSLFILLRSECVTVENAYLCPSHLPSQLSSPIYVVDGGRTAGCVLIINM